MIDLKTLSKKSFSKFQIFGIIVLVFLLLLNTITITAHAAGLNAVYEDNGLDYTKYDDSRYSLDYYKADEGFLDLSWVFNMLCNALFGMSRALSNFTGSVVKEAYNLDFVKSFATQIGQSIQSVAGVRDGNISNNGLFSGFLLLVILAVGLYVVYVGLIKHSTSKALSACFNFVAVFLIGICFVSYAPNLIVNVADFSSEVNTSVLSASTNVFFSSGNVQGADSTELIVNNLWNVQVKQPWLLLEFGTTDVSQGRIDAILNCEADTDERNDAVKTDSNDYNNNAFGDVGNKLGTTLLMLVVNLVISLFVFLLTGAMIISQFLFLIYAAIMPFVFVFSMFPGMQGKLMNAAMKLFNLLLSKTVISFVMTIAFTMSGLFMTLSQDMYYLFVAFLQILCFVGIWKNLNPILEFFGLGSFSDATAVSQGVGKTLRRTTGRIIRMKYYDHRFHKRAKQREKQAEKRQDKAANSSINRSSSYNSDNSQNRNSSPESSYSNSNNTSLDSIQRQSSETRQRNEPNRENNRPSSVSGSSVSNEYRTSSSSSSSPIPPKSSNQSGKNNSSVSNNSIDNIQMQRRETQRRNEPNSGSNRPSAASDSSTTNRHTTSSDSFSSQNSPKSFNPSGRNNSSASNNSTDSFQSQSREIQQPKNETRRLDIERRREAQMKRSSANASEDRTSSQSISDSSNYDRDYSRDYSIDESRYHRFSHDYNVNLNGRSVNRDDVKKSERIVSKRENYFKKYNEKKAEKIAKSDKVKRGKKN